VVEEQRDAAGACAKIQHAQLAREALHAADQAREALHRSRRVLSVCALAARRVHAHLLAHLLRDSPRDEHAAPAADLQVAKVLGPQQVLQRRPQRPLPHQIAQKRAFGDGVTSRVPGVGHAVDVFTQPAQLVLCGV
jgi:hypothetical protein